MTATPLALAVPAALGESTAKKAPEPVDVARPSAEAGQRASTIVASADPDESALPEAVAARRTRSAADPVEVAVPEALRVSLPLLALPEESDVALAVTTR